MKTLILGLGNPLLRDDSVGLRIARQLMPLLQDNPDVEIDVDYWGGLRLMERMIGYEKAIIVDAICSGKQAGTIHLISPGDLPTQRSASPHDVNLPTALEFGRSAGASLPLDENILLVAIEAGDVLSFDETLTPAVEDAMPEAIRMVLSAIEENGRSDDLT
jgi:hydrogenase maturation protease